MHSLDETFGSSNLKWFMIWNLFFFVYSIVIQSSLLSVLCLLIAFGIGSHIAVKLLTAKEQPAAEHESTQFLAGYRQSLTDSIYTISNGVLNWLAKIFTSCDVVEIGLCLIYLSAVETLCFYASDLLIVYVLGNILILLKGLQALSKPYILGLMRLKDSLKNTVGSWLPKSATVK